MYVYINVPRRLDTELNISQSAGVTLSSSMFRFVRIFRRLLFGTRRQIMVTVARYGLYNALRDLQRTRLLRREAGRARKRWWRNRRNIQAHNSDVCFVKLECKNGRKVDIQVLKSSRSVGRSFSTSHTVYLSLCLFIVYNCITVYTSLLRVLSALQHGSDRNPVNRAIIYTHGCYMVASIIAI